MMTIVFLAAAVASIVLAITSHQARTNGWLTKTPSMDIDASDRKAAEWDTFLIAAFLGIRFAFVTVVMPGCAVYGLGADIGRPWVNIMGIVAACIGWAMLIPELRGARPTPEAQPGHGVAWRAIRYVCVELAPIAVCCHLLGSVSFA